MLNIPDPGSMFPLEHHKKLVFLKNIIYHKNIEVGDYTYYDDLIDPLDFENKNVLYHFDFIGDKLIIGKFCAIASGVKFIMNGANHEISPISTYPFAIFGKEWAKIDNGQKSYPYKGNTVIGNDVWIGYDVTIMPGIKIGNGAIIASKSVVTKNIPDYTIFGGNPARIIRSRFADDVIQRILKISWWNWDLYKITENLHLISSNNIDALELI